MTKVKKTKAGPIVCDNIFESVIKLWLENKHLRITVFLVLNGVGSYYGGLLTENETFGLMFGASINYVLYLISERLKSEQK